MTKERKNNGTKPLEVKNLTVELGGYTIVDSISFSVSAGSTTAIIGPNGAGKSILLKAILQLEPKTSGEVLIFGTPHEKYGKIAKLVSYIPQYLNFDRLFPLTVQGLFSLKSPQAIGMSHDEHDRMHRLLDLVGMKGKENERINALSGGQLQRILVAYSLTDKPKLLFLDEPSAGIDVHGQETIYTLLERIQKEEHLTMVLVSHEIEIVMEYADQVLCLNKKLLCNGAPRKILTNELLHEMYGMHVGHFKHNHHDS